MNFINSNLLYFPFPQNYSCIFHKKMQDLYFNPAFSPLPKEVSPFCSPSAFLHFFHKYPFCLSPPDTLRQSGLRSFIRGQTPALRPFWPGQGRLSHSSGFPEVLSFGHLFASRFLRTHPPYPAKCQTFQKYVLLAFFVRIANHTRAAITRTMTAKIGMVIETT